VLLFLPGRHGCDQRHPTSRSGWCIAQEHVPGLAEVTVLVRRPVGWCRWRCGWTPRGPLGADRGPVLTAGQGLARPGRRPAPGPGPLPTWPRLIHRPCAQGCRRSGAGYGQAMTRTERLTERAISFALAEADEDLGVARLGLPRPGRSRRLGRGDRHLPGPHRPHPAYPLAGYRLSGQGPLRGPADPGAAGRFQRRRLQRRQGSGPRKLPGPEVRRQDTLGRG
jgi:hypothetical protein